MFDVQHDLLTVVTVACMPRPSHGGSRTTPPGLSGRRGRRGDSKRNTHYYRKLAGQGTAS